MKQRLILLFALLLMLGISPAAAQKPEITIKQVLQLDHFGNPYKVLKKANVQPITYQQPNDSLPYIVAFGRNVEWDMFFVNMKITGPDALGINNNDIGSGAWELITTHTEWLDAYIKEAFKLGYVPEIDGEYVPGSKTLQWRDNTDWETGEVNGKYAQMAQMKKGEPTNRIIYINVGDNFLHLQFGWEF